jgi:pimeloyl-ACP methyl ester carboxylesterase
MRTVERRYLSVDGRRVHYRRAGSGPPLVMLHGSPGDSAMLAGEMAVLAGRFTCFALDTPGFGGSDPLPGDSLTVPQLAGATAAAMAALGLGPCPVYGTHTGAAIGLELGVGWPDQVSGLVLEGLPMFTPAEIAVLFEGYFAPMVADALGGHLTRTWMRFRDQFTWFPWLSRDVGRLNPVDRPTPEEIDHWVSMFYRSCRTYGPAYKAACHYGPFALAAVERLTLPAVFMASAEDMLFPHLDRLPPLRDGQSIARLPYDPEAKYGSIAELAAGLPGTCARLAASPSIPDPSMLAGADPALGFVGTPDGQVFVRAYGDPSAAPVVLLHDAPGTGLRLEALARALAASAYVVVPDLPGCGKSDPPAEDRPILDVCALAVEAVASALRLERYVLAASGAGAAVAAQVAGRPGGRASAVILDGPPAAPLPESEADAIAPDLPLSPEGAHWLKAWLMVRDGEIYRPWFDGRVAAQRATQGNFDADWLHDQTVALMDSRTTFQRLARAAARFDIANALAEAATPVTTAEEGAFAAAIAAALPAPAA